MFFESIKGLLGTLPSQCQVCRSWPSQAVCESCVNQFARLQPRCATCALPLPEGVDQCGACLRQPPPLDACLAAVPYDYPWATLIGNFKFQAQPGLARALAMLVRSTPWVEPALDNADHVVPMPVSRERLQTRGFNQALVLARQLAPKKTRAGLLLRIKDTPPQRTLKRADRLTSVLGVFALEPLQADLVVGKTLVLVDDVMTSGASMFAAAQVLRAAGAAHITGVVVARTA